MQRRTLLAAIGSGAVTLQAGCLAQGFGESDDPEEAGGDTEDSTGDGNGDTEDEVENGDGGDGDTSEPDVEPEIRGHSVETGGTNCMSDDEDGGVEVQFESQGVSISGVAAAPNPCHEAVIESASVDRGELRVGLAFEETDEVCTECVGAIRYSATVDLDGADGLDTVTVQHGDDGKTYTVKRGGGD